MVEETSKHRPFSLVAPFGWPERTGFVAADLTSRPEDMAGAHYLDEDGRVRGVLMVNMDGRLDAAREILAEDWQHSPGDLVSRIA